MLADAAAPSRTRDRQRFGAARESATHPSGRLGQQAAELVGDDAPDVVLRRRDRRAGGRAVARTTVSGSSPTGALSWWPPPPRRPSTEIRTKLELGALYAEAGEVVRRVPVVPSIREPATRIHR